MVRATPVQTKVKDWSWFRHWQTQKDWSMLVGSHAEPKIISNNVSLA